MATTAIAHRQNELDLFLLEILPEQKQDDKPRPALPVEPLDLDDAELLRRAREADNGAKFSRFFDAGNITDYPSHSEADLAFCGMLAFWCGRDKERMDRLFRRSGLYRDKWDRADYRNWTLDKAIADCREVYTPPKPRPEPCNGDRPPENIWSEEGFTSEKPTDTGKKTRPDQEPDGQQFTQEELLEAASSEQDGDSALFVKLFRDRFRYDHSSGKWYEWAGHYWKEDLLNEPLAAIEAVTGLYEKEAERLHWASVTATKAGRTEDATQAENGRKVFRRKISCLQKLAWKQSVLQLAVAGENSLGITGDEWDTQPWALPCVNGVVNLKDGSFRPGKPEDYLKTVCPTEWKGLDEPAPIFEHFERSITDDKEIPSFKRRLFGSALPGTVIDRTLPVFEGPGGQNGKGTELETIKFTLGPLAGPIPSELLLKQGNAKNPDAPSASIMALRGKRIVWASETERGREFNTQKVKWLTGGDTLVGRDPFGRRQVEFTPSHSVFLLTNDKPRVPASDHAFWERAF